MVNLKLEDTIYFKNLFKKSSFNTQIQSDVKLVRSNARPIWNYYKTQYSNSKLSQFIDDTYQDIIEWNLDERLNGSIAFSGPLRYAFLAKIFPRYIKNFPESNIFFLLGEERYEVSQFQIISVETEYINLANFSNDKKTENKISINLKSMIITRDIFPRNNKEMEMAPYLMHTDPNSYPNYFS